VRLSGVFEYHREMTRLAWALVLLVVGACGDDDDDDTIGPPVDGGPGADGAAGDDAAPGSDGGGGDGDAAVDPVLTDHVTDHGVTWTFAAPALVGQFVTGDFWVIGPVTISAIDPPPANGRNGSVVNLPAVQDRSGFDDRIVQGRFDATLRSEPPIDLATGDRLASSISVDVAGVVPNWLREEDGETSESPVRSVSVLTCLAEPPPADAFRPSYADPTGRLYRLSQVNRALLPRLAPPAAADPALLEEIATRHLRPWIDNLFFAFDAQEETMPMYGREMGRVAGMSSLFLMLELPPDQEDAQERLLVGFLQQGIDLWGLVRAGYPGWQAHGGHGSGRKWPIVLSGMLLGDAEMAAPGATFPEVRFGEDMQTATVADLAPPADQPGWWNDATVVYAGHTGVLDGVAVSDTPGWGPYEHLAPSAWEAELGESYRRCCTSQAWVGEALAAHLVGAEEEWGHDAFFAYVDRWMDPTGDAEYTQAIFDQTGWDYRASWAAQGQGWDDFVEEMWAAYR
jgi:hypothetical protein